MRIEPYVVGDYLHVVKRGVKKLPIVRDLEDRWRFLKLLYYFNDEYIDKSWEERTAKTKNILKRPEEWPVRKPLVEILAFCLMPNHLHLFLKEIREGGISRFMKKLSNSMSAHFNLKYKESGTMFEGPFKARRVDSDEYLRYLAIYIMVKNSFELYKGGIKNAVSNFDEAFAWATSQYSFSSLPEFVSGKRLITTNSSILTEIYHDKTIFKNHSRDIVTGMKFDKIKHLVEI